MDLQTNENEINEHVQILKHKSMILQKVLETFHLIISLVIRIFISLTPTFKVLTHHTSYPKNFKIS